MKLLYIITFLMLQNFAFANENSFPLISYIITAPQLTGPERVEEDKMNVTYFWNDEKVGENDKGIEGIFDKVRKCKTNTVKLNLVASKGSEGITLEHTPPLLKGRFHELIGICRLKKMNILLVSNPILWPEVPKTDDVKLEKDDFGS